MNDTSDSEGFNREGGLNSTDTGDWAAPKTTSVMRTMALVVLPLIFGALVLLAIFLLVQRNILSSATKPVAAISAPVSEKDAQIAQLEAQVVTLNAQLAHPAVAATTPAPAQPVYAADPAALARLSARIDRIEANQKAIAQAAVSANAAMALQQASKGPAPFLSELATVQASLNDPGLTGPLQPLAERGVPSSVTLAIAFPAIASRANIAAKSASGDDSLLNRLKHFLGSFISIRHTDRCDGQGTESILCRAETRLNAGDLKAAVGYLDTLPVPAQRAIAPWMADAHARVLVDDSTARITATALNHLSQTNFDASQDLPAPTTTGNTL